MSYNYFQFLHLQLHMNDSRLTQLLCLLYNHKIQYYIRATTRLQL